MSKLGLFMTSLLPAGIGGYLSYLMVMVFLKLSGDINTLFLVISGVALTCSSIMALMPVGILIFTPKAKQPDAESEAESESETVKEDDEDESSTSEEGDGFNDAIPDDWNEDEARESNEAADDDEFGDGDFDDFDVEDDEDLDMFDEEDY